jgi:hypothetical protein
MFGIAISDINLVSFRIGSVEIVTCYMSEHEEYIEKYPYLVHKQNILIIVIHTLDVVFSFQKLLLTWTSEFFQTIF